VELLNVLLAVVIAQMLRIDAGAGADPGISVPPVSFLSPLLSFPSLSPAPSP